MPEKQGTKRCSQCRVEKPVGAFSRDRSKRSGLAHRCRECDSKRGRDYRERMKALHTDDNGAA